MPTGTLIEYPATLPGPTAAGLQAAERRMLADEPMEARTIERDRRKRQHIALPPFTAEEAAEFRVWYENDLEAGGAWFAAPWPFPAALVGSGYASAVRRWIGEPVWRMLDGFWVVTGDCEVRGLGMPPRRVDHPMLILGMHFDGGIIDETGHSTRWKVWQPFALNMTFPSGAPKFGTANLYGADEYHNIIVSDDRGALVLNASGQWRVRFWCQPEATAVLGWNGGGVIELHYGGINDFDGSATTAQLRIQLRRVLADLTKAYLYVEYLVEDAGFGVPDLWELKAVSDDPEDLAIPIDGDWHFVEVGGDATSTRAYIDGALVADDHDTILSVLAGDKPMMVGAFTGQCFVIGGLHGGFNNGGPPHPNPTNWLDNFLGDGYTEFNAIFTKQFRGGLDDLTVEIGAGPTGDVPASAFANP